MAPKTAGFVTANPKPEKKKHTALVTPINFMNWEIICREPVPDKACQDRAQEDVWRSGSA